MSLMISRAEAKEMVVLDSLTCEPLTNASVFGRNGAFIGMSNSKGRLPHIASSEYPLTVRYMGYKERTLEEASDTIFLQENQTELEEVVVESKAVKALHILAYVREYSTLSTYKDTVFMFREKTVDYMIPTDDRSKFKGWHTPRILYSKSYYRFTDEEGLDSVSDACSYHFSWADWVGISPEVAMPPLIANNDVATDTVYGLYSPAETWVRNGDKLRLDLNIIADTTGRKWVPNLSSFFRNGLDYERFKIHINYDFVDGSSVSPRELTSYSFNIESNGRGREVFMFGENDQPFYVTTYAEVYIVDKEFIPISEAKKWAKHIEGGEIGIIEANEAPPLQASVVGLIERVNNIAHDELRLGLQLDQRLVSHRVVRSFGEEMFMRVKNLFGIGKINGMRKQEKKWREFKRSRTKHHAPVMNIEGESIPGN